MDKWNSKNVLSIVLYAVLYAFGTVITCVLGSFHPIMFTCYQITAAILLSGVVIKAFRKVRSFGVAICLALAVVLVLVLIQDALAWHVIPLVVIALLAEIVRAAMKYSWKGDVISTVIMSFSTFGYYGQIWFNRAFTYQSAVEEMPAGYADTLMAVSPNWALPVVIVIGIVLSLVISNVTASLFHLEK